MSSTPTKITPHIIVTKSGFKFIVTQSPDPNNLQNYKDLLSTNSVKTVVKLCEGTRYDHEYLECNGIKTIDIPLADGTVPSKEVLNQWINIIKTEIKNNKDGGMAVHCVSGLGRAPLFVCIALIKIDKMEAVDAITMVRKTIKSALNTNQIKYLETVSFSNETRGGCIIC